MVSKLGKVYLVGAGPGDPGLLTLKGLDCLQRADLVLYDGLVNPLLLRHTSADAEKTSRTSTQSKDRLPQDEVNARMIDAALEGKTVVRLKGGDPFIFGRGGEEARALADAGIPFEIVPGITAATAASVYAGISLTHREWASSVAFVTGHEDPTKGQPSIDYDLLARFSGTLVFYMGLHRLDVIVDSLLKAGKDKQTPACVISRATTPLQQTVTAPLCELVAAVDRENLKPPSLIVVGECVTQRETIAWFEKRPLFGTRIGITRPVDQAGPTIAQALELGAQPVLLPTIQILPPENFAEVDSVIGRLDEFDWIVFTSSNGVNGLLDRIWEIGGDLRQLGSAKLAVIGPGTAEALQQFHLRSDLMPESYRAEALAEALKPHVAGKRVLWARADRGRDVLPKELEQADATLEQLTVYRNVDVQPGSSPEWESAERGDVDWIGLSSPSIARNLPRLLSTETLSRVKLVSISPVTSEAAREAGLTMAAEATEHTWNGILQAIMLTEGSLSRKR
ncbi:MAG: uroporphyrinogen-III C-methyltransferase [Planctomycetes bacterium]|nr:uroporphyrinogen-III C-methyltransferase [Planctomycetota bacterium]